MSNRSIPSNFLKSVLQNGAGRYVCQLQRITLCFCKSDAGSRGMRDFIENHLLEFTRNNPGIVVYLKPQRHRSPKLVAEYLNGNTVEQRMHMLPQDQICHWMEHFRTRSGVEIVRLRKSWHTDSPSVQGPWTPFTNKDTSWNVSQFPNLEIGRCTPLEPSATERLMELAKQLRIGQKSADIPEGSSTHEAATQAHST